MKLGLRSAVAGAAVLAITGGVLAATASAAFAVGGGGATPPWQSTVSPAELGGITFYNAQGQVVTGGSITASGLAAYAVASAPYTAAPGYTKASLYAYTPVAGQNPGTWSGGLLSTATTFPNAAAPGGIGTTTNAVESNPGTDIPFSSYISSFPNVQTATGYVGVYDIRLKLTGIGLPALTPYYDAVISVNITGGTATAPTAGTWSVSYPDWTQNTTTTLTANPQTQTTFSPSPVTLTATVAPATAGTVSFYSGTTQVGATHTVTATSGVATVSVTPPIGTTPYQAFFTPAISNAPAGTGNALASYDIGSASSVVNTTVATGGDVTATTLAETGGGGPAAGPVTFTGTVTDTTTATSTPTGTVSLFDNGSTTPFASTTVGTGGAFSVTYTYTAAGAHQVVATYAGAAGSPGFAASSSAPVAFTQGTSTCPTCSNGQTSDVQTIEGTVPAGTISISTPYTATNPLNLGTLALNPAGTYFTASASLDTGTSNVPGVNFNGITVVDTQSGNLPWTISALASNLTDGTGHPGGTISGENVGLTNLTPVYVSGNAIVSPDVVVTNYAAATPPVGPTDTGSLGLGGTTAHVIATDSAQPVGTVGINGTVTLNAPTSTEAGVFTGTITFTVS